MDKNNLKALALTTFLVLAVTAILLPIFAQSGEPHCDPPSPVVPLKQLGTANIIYSFDFDDRFPNASSMPTYRAQIFPYIKNESLLLPFREMSQAPQYNFNVAGVDQTTIPENIQSTGTQAYALANPKIKPNSAYTVFIDSHVKLIPLPRLLESLQLQYNRSGTTLAPADYLANQDPLTRGVK